MLFFGYWASAFHSVAHKDINTKSNHREMKKGQILEQQHVICIAAEIWHAPDSSDDEVWGLERKTDQREGDLEEIWHFRTL